MMNFTRPNWIPSFVANLKSFENVVDANGEIVAFATITNLEVIKENDKSFYISSREMGLVVRRRPQW